MVKLAVHQIVGFNFNFIRTVKKTWEGWDDDENQANLTVI